METAARSSARASGRSGHVVEAEALTDYCWRPACRQEFRRAPGPGRRQEYCSDICRRAAEKELRQARSRLAHFEELVEKLRIDVAAFGRPDPDVDDHGPLSLDTRRIAENAVRRAAGVLVFANSVEPAVRELKMLYEAVVPIIVTDRQA